MSTRNSITGIVIAGGKSSRMGYNKILLNYNGKRLIDNAIHVLESLSDNVIISANDEIEGINYPLIKDEFPEIGPISGLYSGLKASQTEINLVIPVDVPNLNSNFYGKLLHDLENYETIVPRLPDGKLEPLIACYTRSIVPKVYNSIINKDYKLVNLIKQLRVKYFDITDADIFKNLNSPEDLL